jgi:hypothetical protein
MRASIVTEILSIGCIAISLHVALKPIWHQLRQPSRLCYTSWIASTK